MVILFVLLGIIAEIVKVNAWFLIPDYISWICFGFAFLTFLFQVINYFNVLKKIKDI